jgi:hypothetical protein
MKRAPFAASVVIVAFVAKGARADTTPPTTVAQLMVLEPGDPSYKLFHGAIWLDVDKEKWNYRWGGLQCKGRELGDTSIQILFASLRQKREEYEVTVEYVGSEFKGKQYRCITGFTVARK